MMGSYAPLAMISKDMFCSRIKSIIFLKSFSTEDFDTRVAISRTPCCSIITLVGTLLLRIMRLTENVSQLIVSVSVGGYMSAGLYDSRHQKKLWHSSIWCSLGICWHFINIPKRTLQNLKEYMCSIDINSPVYILYSGYYRDNILTLISYWPISRKHFFNNFFRITKKNWIIVVIVLVVMYTIDLFNHIWLYYPM